VTAVPRSGTILGSQYCGVSVFPEPLASSRHDVIRPVNLLSLAIVQEIHYQAADRVFRRFGCVHCFRNLLQHQLSVTSVRKEFGRGYQNMRFKCEFGSRGAVNMQVMVHQADSKRVMRVNTNFRFNRVFVREGATRIDEFQFFRFRATNAKPYPFDWLDLANTEMEYSALLTRVLREYDRRFS
jgi:hypothetical protein